MSCGYGMSVGLVCALTKNANKHKCKTCYGFGLWSIGDHSPLGEMDARDGVPALKCPECGAKGIPKHSWRTLDGRYIPIKELTNDHLKNIITHIKERKKDKNKELQKNEDKLLKKMLAEQHRRKLFKKKFNQKEFDKKMEKAVRKLLIRSKKDFKTWKAK